VLFSIVLFVHAASCSVVVRQRRQQTRLSASHCFPPDSSFNGAHWTDVFFLCSLQVSLQDEEALTRQKEGKKPEPGTNERSRDGDGPKDYYAECLDMSAALDRGPHKHTSFKASSMYEEPSGCLDLT